MTILLIIAVLVSVVIVGALASVVISSHLRNLREKNSEFHRALLKETEERLHRFHTTAPACPS